MTVYDFIRSLSENIRVPFESPVLIFFLILVVILISPFLLKKLKIPGIIGLILSGIIIGPNGLNLLEKNSAVELFSTIGLLYLMFIAGLDLDLNEFRKNKFRSVGFGALTFFIPLFLGIPVCMYILGYDLGASVLIGSMFATHTLIAYPIVSKFGISRNEAVAVTIGGTIIADTTALMILAVTIGSTEGELDRIFWIRMILSTGLFIFIIFYIIPKIARWFFSKLEGEKSSHFIFVLSIVFFSAFLADLSGLEPIIGAFGAGLAVNRLIPHNSVLMNRLEFVGNSLFIPFFLISVGMLVDVRVIFSGPQVIFVAVVFTVVVLFGKWLAAFFIQQICRYSRSQRKLIFGLSISHAAAALAIVLIGYKTGIIDENILNGTIILILITCIIGSVLTERAALKITMDEEHLATLNSGRVSTERILLPVAAFQNMDAYISLASLLTDHSPAFTITLLTVVENNPDTDKNIEISRRWHEKAHRDALSNEVYLDSMITIDVNIVSGILRVSREMPASTILLGWPGKPHFFEKLFGLKTDSIINTSNKKIMVYRPVKPVNIHSKTFLVSPPYSELEPGFPDILYLIDHLTGVSKTKIIYLGTERTVNFIREYHKLNKHKNSPEFRIIPGGEDINIYAEIFREDDLLVFVGSKRGSVSYNEGMESMPSRLGKKFPFNSILLVYPGTSRRTGRFEDYSDPDSRPLKKSIGRVGRWFIEKGKRSG